jgi:hypothetical protein
VKGDTPTALRRGDLSAVQLDLRTDPPPELEPETFSQRLYDSMAPVAQEDEFNQWALLIFINGIGVMFQLLEDWARDTPDGPGWSLLLDLNRCPDIALPWLAQFVGVRIIRGSTPDEMRARIASTDGFRRGTVAAMTGAAKATLTGNQRLIFRERDGVEMGHPESPEYAYCLKVATWESETPDPAATLAALLSQKPGGILLDYNPATMQDYAQVKLNNATYAVVKSRYIDYAALAMDDPRAA